MERVCMYLRKSRADLEAESRGEGETLTKHRKALLKTAKQLDLKIIAIREEIASGESLVHRPQMLELLKSVERGDYDAVLVMDVDRLGRGNMQEQGLILDTFRMSKTKIITPRKTYDLQDEFDEEYSEFEAFMARKELKIITRRLQGGRVRSVEEGNYIGTRPPYGYQIKKLENGRTLEPHPEQAPIIKLIFHWYTHEDPKQRMGATKIAGELNRLGYKSYTGIQWKSSSILSILKNAVYMGRIQWKKKKEKKSAEPEKIKDVRIRPKEEWIDVPGKHEPLVSPELFQKAQKILKTRCHVPYQQENRLTNPLAGLVKCAKCGSAMVYRPYVHQKYPHLMCNNRFCHNKSSRFQYVEEQLLNGLKFWLAKYTSSWNKRKNPGQQSNDVTKAKQAVLAGLERELGELEKQKERLHDFLERGIYDEETYLERTQILTERIDHIKTAQVKASKDLDLELSREQIKKDIVPAVENILDLYQRSNDPAKKNILLKSVLMKAVYKKEKWQKNEHFELVLYPKLP